MVRAEVFLALEDYLTRKMVESFDANILPKVVKIQDLIDSGDLEKAASSLKKLQFEDMFEEIEGAVEFHTQASMVFGASRVSRAPQTTVVGLGFEKLRAVQMVQNFRGYLRAAERQVVEKAVQLIAQSVQKFNKCHEPAGNPEGGQFCSSGGNSIGSIISSMHDFARGSIGSLERNEPSERVVVIDKESGKVLADYVQELHLAHGGGLDYQRKEGTGFSNADMFNEKGEYHTDNSILHIHTHPDDQTFSDGDWRVFARSTIGEMVAISPTMEYRLQKSPEFNSLPWQERTPAEIGRRYDRILDEVFNEYNDPEGQWDDSLAHRVIEETTRRLSDELKVGYTIKVKKAEPALREFESFVRGEGKAYFNMIASLHTSRVSAWGFTAEAMALGLTEYRINEQLDSRTCKVCNMMHGKTFKVVDARALLDVVTRVTDGNELKILQPWPKQTKAHLKAMSEMTPEELVSHAWHTPPFHPRCRGLLGRVGTVTVDLGDATQVPDSEPQKAQFEVLGLKLSDPQFDIWKSKVGLSPIQLLSQLSGVSQSKLIEAALKDGHVAKSVGLEKMELSLNQLIIMLRGVGGKKTVTFDFDKKTLTFIPHSKLLSGGINPVSRDVMKSMYMTAKDLGMYYMRVRMRNQDFLWSEAAILPEDSEWSRIKEEIQSKIPMIPSISLNDLAVIEDVLTSTDSASMIALLALGEVAMFLFDGIEFDGVLKMGDAWSIYQFLGFTSG